MAKNDTNKKAIALHKKLGGKIKISAAIEVTSRAELSLVYTPGVAAVSLLLCKRPKLARDYTIKGKTIAVISDGSAVLGLGNIGPYGALPVMEGKCALFKTFAGVEAFPLVLSTQDPDEIIAAVLAIAPGFGGINLEDISAPKCFYIEEKLREALEIPVIHDDQHGTAIAVLAALINAAKVVKKDLKNMRIAISGAGAAGHAITKLLHKAGVRKLLVVDRDGIIHKRRVGLPPHKLELAQLTNPAHEQGTLANAMAGADAFVGVSGSSLAGAKEVRAMAKGAIVFAMANPVPEISPQEALAGGAIVVGTGRSDYPNQINNSLVFPGLFRGALEHRVRRITDTMKLRAARNLAGLVKRPTAGRVIPGPFDRGVAEAVASAVR